MADPCPYLYLDFSREPEARRLREQLDRLKRLHGDTLFPAAAEEDLLEHLVRTVFPDGLRVGAYFTMVIGVQSRLSRRFGAAALQWR
jgi:hypothetical protein